MNKPRFHAFLKVRQTKPECGRQSLKELLIRPVQRLPSISLLLNGKNVKNNYEINRAIEIYNLLKRNIETFFFTNFNNVEQVIILRIINELFFLTRISLLKS